MISQIREISLNSFTGIYNRTNTAASFYFDLETSITVNGEIKPLFIFGDVSSDRLYGRCIAVLNPSTNFLKKLVSGGAHGVFIPRNKLVGKCDATLQLVITLVKEIKVHHETRYTNGKMRPANFVKFQLE